ncbi:hypothetical protein Q8A67_023433 [Cirrhinus molitorella]|uniref:Galactosylgalactosylxylosylprotein 3-beta-glucuronosyltransferase n=1 Tax=Cirrhinus molitorella TaxID=172907 RepID=A0AA88TB72_9TELE|nr:hypothetical protein Q8A67_023433 [Cirrhinus molitorella]
MMKQTTTGLTLPDNRTGATKKDIRLHLSCITENKHITNAIQIKYIHQRPPPWSDTLPTLHIITPTYSRPVQKAELTRLSNTFLHVPNLHWLVVEDSSKSQKKKALSIAGDPTHPSHKTALVSAQKTALVSRLLENTGLNFTHLNVETPESLRTKKKLKKVRIPRGTMQRNLALSWLRENINPNSSHKGVVYFADDDNTYSLELFEEVWYIWSTIRNVITLNRFHIPDTTDALDSYSRSLASRLCRRSQVRIAQNQLSRQSFWLEYGV